MIRRMVPLVAILVATAGCGSPTAAVPTVAIESPPTLPSGIKTEFVEYVRWAKFKPGTTMVKRTTTETKGHPLKTVEVTTSKLLELTYDRAIVETHLTGTRFDGIKMDTAPVKATISRYYYLQDNVKIKVPKKDKTEPVTVTNKTYQADVISVKDRNEVGEVLTTLWTSDEVPGGLLKSESFLSDNGKLVTIELIELRAAQ